STASSPSPSLCCSAGGRAPSSGAGDATKPIRKAVVYRFWLEVSPDKSRGTASLMTDMIPLETFTPSDGRSEEFVPTIRPRQIVVPQLVPIGRVLEIGGGGARIELDGTRLREIGSDPDPSIALSGQVGGHVKLESGKRWLLANVRNLRSEGAEGGMVIAEIDFLGEGEEHEQTGRLINFKRGITSYPIPGG